MGNGLKGGTVDKQIKKYQRIARLALPTAVALSGITGWLVGGYVASTGNTWAFVVLFVLVAVFGLIGGIVRIVANNRGDALRFEQMWLEMVENHHAQQWREDD